VIRLVRVELVKLVTTRLWWVLLAVAVAMIALIIVLVLATPPGGDPQAHSLHDLATVNDVLQLISIGGISATFALVLGVTMSTSEYRYGTAGTTYLAVPRRARVVSAKILAAAPVGAVFGLIGGSVPLLVALLWFAVKGGSVPLDGRVPIQILEIGLQAAFGAVMGVAIGTVLRNQVAAIVGLLVWVLVVESLLGALIPATAKWFPFSGAAGAFSPQTQSGHHLLARPEAALLMAAYVAAAWFAAIWFERRRDV
jgi:ABC-type transport system involved in multi-copper enzyme maturation permease subunit